MQLVKYFLNERNCIVTLFLVQGIVNRTGAVTPLGRVNEYKRPIIYTSEIEKICILLTLKQKFLKLII